jgi:hypothetical protein
MKMPDMMIKRRRNMGNQIQSNSKDADSLHHDESIKRRESKQAPLGRGTGQAAHEGLPLTRFVMRGVGGFAPRF